LDPETSEPEGDAQAIIDLPQDRETGLRVGRVVFFGPVGSGKTVTGCALAKQMAPPSFEEKYILSPVATAANLLPDYKWFKIDPTDKKQVEAFMATFNDKRAILLIDEADAYFGGSGRTYGTPSMFGAVNWGRNACLALIIIAHGTNVAPKNLIENSAAVFFFRTTTPGLLDYAEDYMPEVPDAAHVLRNLPDHTALVYAPMSRQKFVGFAKLNMDTGEIQIWSPSEEPDTESPSNETEEGGESSARPTTGEASSSPSADTRSS
jgi:hypothetical protein